MTASPTTARPPAAEADELTHEQQLARLNGEVEALRKQLRDSQRLAAVGTMAAMVAHEFNNILTPIVNYAQLARKNPALSEKAIARAHDGGQRATDICKAILGFAGDNSTEMRSVKLAELIAQTLEAMARDPAKDRIDLKIDVPANLELTTRRGELQQVLLNLIINARAAVMEKPGPRSMTISARKQNKQVRITVADNGVGIAPEHMGRIFEPFFSTKTGADAAEPGHGLGLAICRQMITGLGGEISAQSTPGDGATFEIILPV